MVPEPEVIPEKKEEYLKITRDYIYDSCYEETMIAYGHYNTLHLESTEYPELTKAVNSYNTLLSNEMQAGMDKLESIDRARKIGTYELSIEPQPDSCTVFAPSSPSVAAKHLLVEEEEKKIPGLEEALERAFHSIEKYEDL